MASGGAGTSPAGVGPAGYDPVGAPPTQAVVAPSTSVRFDPVTRDFAGTIGGYWDAVHWVDQAVTLALSIERKKLKSAPNVGVRYREIKRLGDDTQSTVEDMTREALADLLGAPAKISVDRIITEQGAHGQLRIAVEYTNLVTRRQQVARASNS